MSAWSVRLSPRARYLLPAAFLAAAWLLSSALAGQAVAATSPVPGGSGTDTALPDTDSAATVTARPDGPFAGFTVHVNQTRDLTNQAISVTWQGGAPTPPNERPFENYVQIMQCWGDDDGTGGPPPEQCVFGAQSSGGHLPTWPERDSPTRMIGHQDDATPPAIGVLDEFGNVWRTFVAVDGGEVGGEVDDNCNPVVAACDWWRNPYFNIYKTNEIRGARTSANGTGAEIFEVQTGMEADWLGCGQQVQPLADGGTKVPRCWLVVVPRGTAMDENVGTPWEGQTTAPVSTSPLSPAAWKHRIAIELTFVPVDSPCPFGAKERRITGSQLSIPAMSSWMPALCAKEGGATYSFARTSETQARQQIVKPSSSSAGMAIVSRPADPAGEQPDDPVLYSPLNVTGAVIAFNLERSVISDDAELLQLAGVGVSTLNLTPRLVAKLLTQSYTSQLPFGWRPPNATWLAQNKRDLGRDPDFLRFNPEFELLSNVGRNFGGLVTVTGSSDLGGVVWAWILADPEAREWLAGTPDEWGMRVNPAFSTDAATNSNGVAFGDPVPESFPRNDNTCYQPEAITIGTQLVDPPQLCPGDWMPFVQTFADAARVTRTGNTAAKIVPDRFATDITKYWRSETPQPEGRRTMLSITDAASAARYGLPTARLSRAGDDGDARDFVVADERGLLTGVDAMEPSTHPAVLEPVPGKAAPGAYPLTMLAYAAIAPTGMDAQERTEYADFLDFAAVGAGQEPGRRNGDLPPGYVPLPASLRQQASRVSELVRNGAPAVPEPEPEPTTTVPAEPATTVPDASTVPPNGSSGGRGGSSTRSTSSSSVSTATTTATTTIDTEPEPSASEPPITAPPAPTTIPAEPDEPERSPSVVTPLLALSRSRFAVPGVGVVALGSGVGALEITKRPRRGSAPKPPAPPAGGG